MTHVDEPLLQRMVAAIVEAADPEQVILFGSRARGDARPDSDVDLVVVEAEPFGPGRVTLSVNEQLVGEGVVPVALRRSLVGHAMMDVGADARSPVSDSYEPPFPFQGEIQSLEIEVRPYEGDAAVQAAAERQRQAMARQ